MDAFDLDLDKTIHGEYCKYNIDCEWHSLSLAEWSPILVALVTESVLTASDVKI